MPPITALEASWAQSGDTRVGAGAGAKGPHGRFRSIQVRPKDVGFPLMQNRTYQRGDPPMTSEPRNLLNPFEILAIVSVCGVLFMAAHSEVGLALWTIPAMTLFTVAGLTLLCVLLFDGVPHRFKDVWRQAS